MKTKHTKGIWKAGMDNRIYNEEMRAICDVVQYGPATFIEDGANARLIAAAPELLEALEFASRWLKDRHGQDFKRIDDAIRKAKGDS